MSKPDYIPQDVWDMADGTTNRVASELVKALTEGTEAPVDGLIQAHVARAIMAERERCASIVETMPDLTLHMWERPGGPPGNGYSKTTRSDIATAIRVGKR